MNTSCVSNNHVKQTCKHGPSLTEVDWGGLKKETLKCGPSLMEVYWAGKIEANHTSGCILSEVDWGRLKSFPLPGAN